MRLLALLFHDVYQRDPSESGFPGPSADRYKLPLSRFDTHLRTLAICRPDRPVLLGDLLSLEGPIPPFTITVDDGGESYHTLLAERLEALGWRGHCFVTTGSIGRRGFLNRSQIRDLRTRGHVIGTHSASHPAPFNACSGDRLRREWADSRAALADIIGEEVLAASVPGGSLSERVVHTAREAGLRILFTSEPQTRVRDADGCLVLGRFTVRAATTPQSVRRLALLSTPAILRAWLWWNAKTLFKTVAGGAYPWEAPRRSRTLAGAPDIPRRESDG